MRAVVATRLGGPEVLQLQDVPEPAPAAGVLIRVASAGVNFADALATQGKYAASPPPPFVPGMEVAGVEVSSGRPVMALLLAGGYAEVAAADPRLVFDATGLDLGSSGGHLLVTLTAYYALAEMARLRPGESVLVTAGAGGLGSTVIQVAKALGAGRVVAVCSTEDKRRFALEQGADAAVGYDDPLPRSEVVFDSVGGEVVPRLLDAVPHLGRILLIGASSGTPPEIPGFDALRRRNAGVLCFSFGMLRRGDPERVAATAGAAVDLVRSGKVRPAVGRAFPLEEAAAAHRALVGRQTVGKQLLIP
jgi:NADPH2:quinone reductase